MQPFPLNVNGLNPFLISSLEKKTRLLTLEVIGQVVFLLIVSLAMFIAFIILFDEKNVREYSVEIFLDDELDFNQYSIVCGVCA